MSLLAHGGNCNGAFDNSTAIANAAAAAKSQGLPLLIPAGICAYGDVIRLDGVKLRGSGDASVLYALDWTRQAIFLRGDGAEVSSLKLSGVKAPSRQANWEMTRITLFGATNFVIDNVTIDGSAAAGIQTAQAARNGRITNNRISDTLSDAIHMTDRASFIAVEGNSIADSGDDGIAVVSYVRDGGLVNNITARNNTVRNNKWGRLMSVVGGENVLYENNLLDTNLSPYACLYLAQENVYNTYGVKSVIARFNTMKNCGSSTTGHAAIMSYSDGSYPNSDITLQRNDVVQSGPAGVRAFGPQTQVVIDSNRITGSIEPYVTGSIAVTPYLLGPVGYTGP